MQPRWNTGSFRWSPDLSHSPLNSRSSAVFIKCWPPLSPCLTKFPSLRWILFQPYFQRVFLCFKEIYFPERERGRMAIVLLPHLEPRPKRRFSFTAIQRQFASRECQIVAVRPSSFRTAPYNCHGTCISGKQISWTWNSLIQPIGALIMLQKLHFKWNFTECYLTKSTTLLCWQFDV